MAGNRTLVTDSIWVLQFESRVISLKKGFRKWNALTKHGRGVAKQKLKECTVLKESHGAFLGGHVFMLDTRMSVCPQSLFGSQVTC